MKKYFYFILFCQLFLILLTCHNTVNCTEKVVCQTIDLTICFADAGAKFCHIYCENLHNRQHSKAWIKKREQANAITAELYPGIYQIYIYGLSPKTEKTYQVNCFAVLTRIKLFARQKLSVRTKLLTPEFNFTLDQNNKKAQLEIKMKPLCNLFSLSSLSIKQGKGRVKALKPVYQEATQSYLAPIELLHKGDWLFNVSFYLKSKKDPALLEQSNIQVSTSYFKNIFLAQVK